MKKIIFSIILFVLTFPIISLAQGNPPSLPLLVYGDVTLHGSPAPIGTIISIEKDNTEITRIVLATVGKYSTQILSSYSGSLLFYKVNGTLVAQKIVTDPLITGSDRINLTIGSVSDGTINGDNTNVSLNSASAGEADMPTGATNIVLSNTTTLDLSSSKVAQTSTNVTVAGSVVVLTQKVVLQSGVSGSPIVLTNSNLSSVSASIPDGTKIQGPASWDGKIMPPVTGTSTGTAPAGFSVGGTVISVGSLDGTLVFDKPVTLLLTGVTGTVGYKPSGLNTWIQITNACGGSYSAPTAPAYPEECAISNGTDTKIVTYHFTSFGSLTSNSSGGGGGGGGGDTQVVTATIKKGDANIDGKVDKYDFALMMANWGKIGTSNSDFNIDGKVDKYDFALLMSNWGL